MISDTAHWPSGPVKIVWREANDSSLPVTGAHGFCFHKGAVVVCSILGRGMTIPGGHLDEGESPEDCIVREATEEACVELRKLKLLGYIEADHSLNAQYDGPYPMRSVQAIYRADVESVAEFSGEHEANDRQFIDTSELPGVHHEWNDVLQAALEAAIANGG